MPDEQAITNDTKLDPHARGRARAAGNYRPPRDHVMRATCLVCTLKRSPEESNSESLAQLVFGVLRDEGVKTDVVRLADHQIDFGVVSYALSSGDEWPAIRESHPGGGHPHHGDPDVARPASSVSKVALGAHRRLSVRDTWRWRYTDRL